MSALQCIDLHVDRAPDDASRLYCATPAHGGVYAFQASSLGARHVFQALPKAFLRATP
jgi:hypothetical protein